MAAAMCFKIWLAVKHSLCPYHYHQFSNLRDSMRYIYPLCKTLTPHERAVFEYFFKDGAYKMTSEMWREFGMWISFGGGWRFTTVCAYWCEYDVSCIENCPTCSEAAWEEEGLKREDVDLWFKGDFNPPVSYRILSDYPYIMLTPHPGHAVPEGWGRDESVGFRCWG